MAGLLKTLARAKGLRLIPDRKPWYEGPEIAALEPKHLEGALLLPAREDWVARLPKEGVGAEIGVAFGDFTKQLEAVSSKLHLVDSWASKRYEAGLRKVEEMFAQRIAAGEIQIHRGISVEAMTQIPDGSLDWIYIDTNHEYETTKAELLLGETKVKPGGIIAGHDFSRGNPYTGGPYGVIAAVNEFCVERDWKFEYLTMEPTMPRSFSLKKI